MAPAGADKSDQAVPLGLGPRGLLPNPYDVVIFILMAGIFVLLAHGAREMGAPLTKLNVAPVTLDPTNLPEYALRTTLRMFAAILVSLLFTFVVGTLAGKSRKAELIIVPALDILQSVPILGFLTFTVIFFLRLFPGSELGAECAAIFAIFTSQACLFVFFWFWIGGPHAGPPRHIAGSPRRLQTPLRARARGSDQETALAVHPLNRDGSIPSANVGGVPDTVQAHESA
jgi:hypothetical protein